MQTRSRLTAPTCLWAALLWLVVGGGASAGTAPAAAPPGGSTGCQLDAAAFCDSFDNGPSQGGKSGDLNPAKWHITRINPAYQFEGNWSLSSYNEFPAVPVTPCRAGLSSVLADNDAVICDAASGHGGELMTAIMAQFYGLYSLRPNQPFDFAGRTGTIVFDVDAATGGALDKWVSVYITDEPVNGAHSLRHTTGLQPNNGVGVEFAVTCGTNYQQAGVSDVFTYTDHVESTAFAGDNTRPCIKTSKGNLNHFELRLSESQIEIWGSDFSSDRGAGFPNFRLLQSVPLSLSFNRGYVHFQVGIRAPLKYAASMDLDTLYAQYYWKNLGFDGPVLPPDRVYQVDDAGTAAPNGGTNLGYKILDGTVAGQQQGMYTCCAETRIAALPVKGVDLTNAAGAFLSLDAYLTPGGDFDADAFAIEYRLNGGAWQAPLTAPPYAIMVHDSTWWSGLVLPVPLGDLRPGDNTLEFTTKNGNEGYPTVLSNVDLVISTTTTTTTTSAADACSGGDTTTSGKFRDDPDPVISVDCWSCGWLSAANGRPAGQCGLLRHIRSTDGHRQSIR